MLKCPYLARIHTHTHRPTQTFATLIYCFIDHTLLQARARYSVV